MMQETLHAYVRVSTKGQLVGKSIESQIEIAKKVAKMLDMKCEIRILELFHCVECGW